MKKLIFLLFLVLLGAGGYFFLKKETPPPALSITRDVSNTTNSPKSSLPEEENTVSNATPTRIAIPSINVDAEVESVGMDDQGRMDVPKEDQNAAWYNLGFKPGEKGSAVLAGHFDTITGSPAVFYDVGKLKKGDTIEVTMSDNKKLSFTVTNTELFPFDDFPLQQVFNTTDKPRLNIITCDGVWDKEKKTYSQRLVIFTELSS